MRPLNHAGNRLLARCRRRWRWLAVAALFGLIVVTAPAFADPTPAPSPGPAPTPPGASSTPSPSGPGVPDPGVRPPGAPSSSATPPSGSPSGAPSQPPSDVPSLAPAPGPPSDDPGLFDIPGQIRKAITSLFSWMVEQALNPVLDWLGHTLLATPDLTSHEAIRSMWTANLVLANSFFVLFVTAAAFIVSVRQTLQTRYGVKELAPRLVLAMVLANTSLLLFDKAIELVNALTQAIAGEGVDPDTAAQALIGALGAAREGSNFLVTLLVLGAVMIAIVVTITFLLRIAVLGVLIGLAPPALLCLGLPQTEPIARTWVRAVVACFGIQIGQAVILLAAIRLFLTPAGPTVLGFVASGDGYIQVLVCYAMLYLLIKLPGWMRQFVLCPGGGRGLLSQLVHTILMIKTMGTAAGLLKGGATAGRAAGSAGRPTGPSPARTGPRPSATRTPSSRTPSRPRIGPIGRPGPVPFSHAPAVHAPLTGPAGTTGGPVFSDPPPPAAPRPAATVAAPPVVFSDRYSPVTSPRPGGSRPEPVTFSHPPTRPSTPAPTGPAPAVTFSSATVPQTAPRRPPAPVTPVFSSASRTANVPAADARTPERRPGRSARTSRDRLYPPGSRR